MRVYSDPEREMDPYALPDVEVFHVTERGIREWRVQNGADRDDDIECPYSGPGFYYWFCFPGCLPDSDPVGPFATEEEAVEAAQEGNE